MYGLDLLNDIIRCEVCKTYCSHNISCRNVRSDEVANIIYIYLNLWRYGNTQYTQTLLLCPLIKVRLILLSKHVQWWFKTRTHQKDRVVKSIH